MKITKTSDPEDLLRRIDARIQEIQAKEKEERANRNRENAQNSTGPKTPEGKQRSSQNSLKHGFYADVEKLDPRDSPAYQDELAEAYRRAGPDLDRLHRNEVYLRRAFDRTLDRLQRMQRERRDMPLNEALKQTEVWLTYESKRTNNPHLMPARSMYIDEKGELTQMNQPYERTGSPQADTVVREKGMEPLKEEPEAA